MNTHRLVDGIAALAILVFVTLEYGLSMRLIPDSMMALGDAGLHVLIFMSLAWHFLKERFNGKDSG